MNAHVSQGGWPVLVLNADFRPLSYYPLSLWSWQDAIKAVFLDRVNIVEHYDRAVRSPSFEIQLPSVVSLKSFVQPTTHPAFTRFNVFLRDRFVCQYCSADDDLTFDHIVPRSRGGQTTWENVVAACSPCNLRKGNLTPQQARMFPQASRRSRRRCISCIATADCFRRTICTIAGSIISTGTPSSIREVSGMGRPDAPCCPVRFACPLQRPADAHRARLRSVDVQSSRRFRREYMIRWLGLIVGRFSTLTYFQTDAAASGHSECPSS